ncbi:restriction endonuclease subunit S [Akkermansia muciniphila]|jgi:type I restriction enzyme S subunit|uniref:restriction endonuclease subunit S n=1 Tax=Akkermansia TaxID=239934 RepID=UPI000C9A7C99|nr:MULTISPECIES: restriction endonuclease subunit S [Akkermansia]MCC8093538.1 restriction endonuclease subunit S [Akkermansia sp.]PND13736.1 restriction endonuclease subunit S [Akkermansia muciniphila]
MKYKWGDLITLEYGKPVKDKDSKSGNIPVFGTNGQIGTSHLPPLCPHASFILGRKGAYRGVHYSDVPFSVIDTAFYAKNIRTDILSLKWAYYKFLTYDINRMDSGSAIPSTDRYEIYGIEVELPPIKYQQKIVCLLEFLNKKIELNNRINDNLEQQAQAIFKSWFIDYEPFNGKIPSTWKEYRLADFFPVVTGKKNANVSSDSGQYPFFSCSQNIAWTDNYSFEGNAILVAGNGDFNVKWYNGKFEAYQRTYVLIPYNPRYSSWLYYAVKYNLAKITSAARGSVIRFITKGNLENFSFLAPRELDKYEIIDTFSTINHAIEQRVQENYRLQVFRDNLLPRLMTGEIDVSSVKI